MLAEISHKSEPVKHFAFKRSVPPIQALSACYTGDRQRSRIVVGISEEDVPARWNLCAGCRNTHDHDGDCRYLDQAGNGSCSKWHEYSSSTPFRTSTTSPTPVATVSFGERLEARRIEAGCRLEAPHQSGRAPEVILVGA